MREFVIPKDPYGEFKLYSNGKVYFNPGVTVLVGCNGSGKSTLLMLLKERIKRLDGVLLLEYDDRTSGGHNLMEKFGFFENYKGLATMMCSSEGERIIIGVGDFISKIRRTVRETQPKELWIFLDAVGSGLSIDCIAEIQDIAKVIVEDNASIPTYFVISTNEYEFAKDADCIDVTTFKHRTFKRYDSYKNFILSTRAKKDKRKYKKGD